MRTIFLVEYIKNIREVGAVLPSSRYLANKMLRSINFQNAKIIVEYGPGTGAFTSEIIKRMQPGTKLLLIESNKLFYELLHTTYASYENIDVINDSAEHIESILQKHKLSAPDYIISGLPFAALPTEVSHAILKSTAAILGNKGVFITFQYTLLKQQLFKLYFDKIKITREFRNLPPAYVLYCNK